MVRVALYSAAAAAAALSTVVTVVSADHPSSSCPIPCHNGRCVEVELGTTYKCDCDPPDANTLLGFSGPACDIPYEQCPDYERRCYNNAECAMSSSTPGKFVCDCSAAYGVSAFAGHECQYSATEVCEAFTPVAEDAFCVNGGRCRDTVLAGEDHPGCDCPEEFEGSKCQYLKGTAPASEEGQGTTSGGGKPSGGRTKPKGEGSTDLHPGIIALIVIVSVVVVGAFAYMIYAKHRSGREGIEKEGELDRETIETDGFANDEVASSNVTGRDLEIQPDGSGTLGVKDGDGDGGGGGGGPDGDGDGDGNGEGEKESGDGAAADGGGAAAKKVNLDDVEIL